MNRLFNLDNPFFTVMGKIADLFLLNFVFLLCCIPIVTIGPAITAMYYVTLKMAKNEESYIFRSFFHSFRQNLKQGILIHLILLVVGLVLVGDFYITARMTAGYVQVVRVLLTAVVVFYYLTYLYTYPVLARFENTIKNTFRNAIIMAIRHLPQTVLMIIVSLSPLLLFLAPSTSLQAMIMFFLILLGPSAVTYINSMLFVKVFSNYIPEEEPIPEFSGSNPEFGVYESAPIRQNEPDIFAQLRNESASVQKEEQN